MTHQWEFQNEETKRPNNPTKTPNSRALTRKGPLNQDPRFMETDKWPLRMRVEVLQSICSFWVRLERSRLQILSHQGHLHGCGARSYPPRDFLSAFQRDAEPPDAGGASALASLGFRLLDNQGLGSGLGCGGAWQPGSHVGALPLQTINGVPVLWMPRFGKLLDQPGDSNRSRHSQL